jgi:hypothetical protein
MLSGVKFSDAKALFIVLADTMSSIGFSYTYTRWDLCCTHSYLLLESVSWTLMRFCGGKAVIRGQGYNLVESLRRGGVPWDC